MKKGRNRRLLIFSVAVALLMFCLTVVCILSSVNGRNISSNRFVDYMITHADEASEDFKECGILFSGADEADMLSVTFPDGRCFYYHTVAENDDRLVKIECSVEKVHGEETLTGSLEVTERGKNEASVAIECSAESYTETRVLNYRLPEFNEYRQKFKSEDTAQRIGQWISTEELAALYEEGKELEEIMSAYCRLKSHGMGFHIYQYTSPYEELEMQMENKVHTVPEDKGGTTDAGNGSRTNQET